MAAHRGYATWVEGNSVHYTVDGEEAEMSCRVAFRSANLLKMSSVMVAAMFAICLVALARTTNTAGATPLPKNGKIVFDSNRNTLENSNPERNLELARVGMRWP